MISFRYGSAAKELQAEIERLCQTEQGSNVSNPNHVTNWTRRRGAVFQFSLLNKSGRYNDFFTDHEVTWFGKRFQASEKYPRLAELNASFPGTINFRLNVLGPRARLSADEIAERLFISEDTVKVHVSRIIDKLGAKHRIQAVAIAVRAGLLVSSPQSC